MPSSSDGGPNCSTEGDVDRPVYLIFRDGYLIAIERIREKSKQLNITDEQKSQLKEQEASEIQSWSSEIDQIEAKINDMDKLMFEPEKNW